MLDIDKLNKRAIFKYPREYKSELRDSKCSVTISVGQSVHEGDKFKALLLEVNDNFKECTIMVCDSLQRHTLKIESDFDMKNLHARSNQLGDEWLERNMEAIKQLDIKHNIMRWDEWLWSDKYEEARNQIDKLYVSDVDFYSAVEKTALSFLGRYLNKSAASELREDILCGSREYLKEEAAVMLIWAQSNYQFEVYPSQRNLALRFVYQNFIAKSTPHLVREISVKFKTVSIKKNVLLENIGDFPEFDGLISSLPGHVYVLDNNNVYKGCNLLQARAFGFNTPKDVIGKKNENMPIFARHRALAEIVDNNNLKIMRNANPEPIELEEEAPYVNSEIATFKSYKIPIFNKVRQVVGLLGISYDITKSKKELKTLQEECAEKDLALDNLLANLPGHVYWMDIKNRFLGCNDQQAHDFCLKSRHEIVGLSAKFSQTPENAATIIKNNNKVMMKGEVITEEEEFKDINGKDCIYFSRKVPLKNKHGEIVGLLGISLDITDKKEKEQMAIENKMHQATALAQEEFRKVVGQMVHDIRTPLSTLQMTMQSTREIPEEKRIALRDATIAITDITEQLLRQYEPEDKADGTVKERQIVIASTILASVAGDGRSRHKNKSIKFIYDITPLNAFLFIKAEPIDLKRSLSNLINNAAEAMPKSGGTIELKLTATEEWVTIKILDDGSGIPKEVLDKINKKEIVTHGKEKGHGLGMSFVRDMVEANHGEFAIASATDGPGHGTTITLRFPRLATPDWEVEEISLTRDDIVIILDDDTSIHRGWDSRLAHILEKVTSIKVEHFSYATDVIDFVAKLSEEEKEKVCLLSDYELIGQELNGLQVIEKVKVKRSILVTSHYANVEVRRTALQHRVKVLPKDLVHVVPINVVQARIKGEMSHVHMVFVDDEKLFTKTLISNHYSHLLTESYSNPLLFLDEVDKYPLDTRIVLDNYYYMEDGGPYNIDGVMLAEKLHAKGFTTLILLSGEEFNVPDFLTLVLKTDKATLGELDRI